MLLQNLVPTNLTPPQNISQVQGQLRIGVSDWGVNAARNAALLASLRAAAADGKLPSGSCAGRWRRSGIL